MKTYNKTDYNKKTYQGNLSHSMNSRFCLLSKRRPKLHKKSIDAIDQFCLKHGGINFTF